MLFTRKQRKYTLYGSRKPAVYYAIKVKFPDEDAYAFVLRPPNIFESGEDLAVPLYFGSYQAAVEHARQWPGLAIIVEYRPNQGWASHCCGKTIDKPRRIV